MRFAASPRPIRRVLIANRGEIALRVMRTCVRLGLATVAVYSDADAEAPHVRAADRAVRVGAAPARESYLDMDAIAAAARLTESDAIHPGYGFLSENAAFVRRCEAEGLIFVGPSADIVGRMGSKIEAKGIAEAAGVATVPGYRGAAQDDDTLARAARQIGYPVMIKASAGGGGRGMRCIEAAEDFIAGLAAARAEAERGFGDGTLLLEKYIANPRHLEVQIAGDRQGNLVHLFERDCSVQRNNQKVIEEAPAPNLPDGVRQTLLNSAVKVCRSIGYNSVGTVEFIMEAGSDTPYFLEMNTRLQVEHAVTEMITGFDLVEWQLIAAAGEELPARQEEIASSGHAIEARITAERADRHFQPTAGTIHRIEAPRALRFDAGVATGSSVSLYYDSLLGKLIAHGHTRESAAEMLAEGLGDLVVLGIPTTQCFLRDALRHPIFARGEATTRFIEQAFPGGWRPEPGELRVLRAAAGLCWIWSGAQEPAGGANPWLRRVGTRVTASVRPATSTLLLADEYGETQLEVALGREGASVVIDGESVDFGRFTLQGDRLVVNGVNGPEALAIWCAGDRIDVARKGMSASTTIELAIDAPRESGVAAARGTSIEAPLHGLISQIYVAVGETVETGKPVVQMEAMKLIHTLSTAVSGTVAAIRCAVGDVVQSGALLVEITPHENGEDE